MKSARLGRVAKNQLEMRVGGKRGLGGVVDARRGKRPYENAFANGLEQARERVCTGLHSDRTKSFRDTA